MNVVRIGWVLLALLVATSARAEKLGGELLVRGDDLVGFGARHQLTISSDAAMSIQQTRQLGTDKSSISVTIAPAMDFFILENFSLGGVVSLQHQRAGKARSTRLSLGPRVGYNVELTHVLSLWPKIGLSYSHSITEDEPTELTEPTRARRHTAGLSIFVPLMIHRVAHFFVGFGPYFEMDLNGANRGLLWGGRLTLGGWL